MIKTLQRHVIGHVAGPFLLGMVVFPFVCVVQLVFRLADLVLNRGAPPLLALDMLFCTAVGEAYISVPMAVLFGVLLGVGRLEADREFLAMRLCGVNLVGVFAPLVGVAAAISGLLIWGNVAFLPTMNLRATDLTMQMQFAMLTRLAPYEAFEIDAQKGSGGRMFFGECDPHTGEMRRITMEMPSPLKGSPAARGGDAGETTEAGVLIVAPRGRVMTDDETFELTVRLADGALYQSEGERCTTVRFGEMERTLPVLFPRTMTGRFKKAPQEMTLGELREEVRNPSAGFVPGRWSTVQEARAREGTQIRADRRFAMEMYTRFGIPSACLAFALLGVPLGLRLRFTSRAPALVAALLVIFGYYGAVNCGLWLGRTGSVAGPLLILGPNVVLGVLGGVMLVRGARR
ncbi:MAG: LptF/LptG family permease [Candidatus Sumerlaeaceae bacterium]|nr:LptF/LptG family permease [Candidatus Sumerlaeaceae bacterium]